MDNKYFLNAEMPPPWHFEPSPMPNWQSPFPLSDCFLHYTHLASPFTSMLSSTSTSASNSNDNFITGELVGKLGNVCTSSGVLPQPHQLLVAPATHIGGGNSNTNTSCYTTPLKSPPRQNLPIMGHISLPLNPGLPSLLANPVFIEQPLKLACICNPSINGGSSHFRSNNNPLMVMGGAKSPRAVLSSPSLKAAGLQMGGEESKNSAQIHMEIRSKGESLVSEQNPSREAELRTPSDSSSRKRKSISRGKSKEIAISTKGGEAEKDPKSKRSKHSGVKNTEKETNGKTSNNAGDECQRNSKTSPKPPEPPKDYIHVRARRGQATDSHSLAERVRREKISERMKLLQGLVPGCNKITGKTVMLDEIINYVRALQNQVEFLSMKIASAELSQEPNMDSLLHNVMIHQNGSLPHPTYALDTLVTPSGGCQQPQQIAQVHNQIPNGAVLNQCSVDPLDTSLCQNTGMNLASVDEFGQVFPLFNFTDTSKIAPSPNSAFHYPCVQFPTSCENDLQNIVQMGFGQNMKNSQSISGSSNQSSRMKIELWSPFINP